MSWYIETNCHKDHTKKALNPLIYFERDLEIRILPGLLRRTSPHPDQLGNYNWRREGGKYLSVYKLGEVKSFSNSLFRFGRITYYRSVSHSHVCLCATLPTVLNLSAERYRMSPLTIINYNPFHLSIFASNLPNVGTILVLL